MVVLVAGERQAVALDGVGDEDHRPVVVDRLEGVHQRRQVVAGEVAHQRRELGVGAPVEQRRHRPLVAELVGQTLAPGGAALEDQRRIERVRAGIDPRLQPFAAGLTEGRLLQRAVLQRHHLPAEGGEDRLEALVEPFAHHGVEALAVVVDDPPGVAQALLPALQQRLEDVALVELGVADQRHHAALAAALRPAVGVDVVLHEARKQRLRHPEADRAGGEVDVVDVLRPRRIGLRALVGAEALELVLGLVAEEVLDGVEGRARVRLHRDAVLGPEHGEIERRQDGGERGGRGLVAADLQPVLVGADVVGVVDRPGGEPQHFSREVGEAGAVGVGHGWSPPPPGMATAGAGARIALRPSRFRLKIAMKDDVRGGFRHGRSQDSMVPCQTSLRHRPA